MAEASCACAVASWAAAAKSHIDQRLHWIGRVLDEFGGEFHVLLGGEVGHQIVELEYESDVTVSETRHFPIGEVIHPPAVV